MKIQLLPPNNLREEALRLLKEGQDTTQIAQALHLPIGKIYYWRRYYLNPFHPFSDGRRLYNDQFKRDVLEQIAAGTSISKLARSLGVSKVTLFKWKREHQAQNEVTGTQEAEAPTGSNPVDVLEEKSLLLPQSTVEGLLERIRVLEGEKDALMKALRIFTGHV